MAGCSAASVGDGGGSGGLFEAACMEGTESSLRVACGSALVDFLIDHGGNAPTLRRNSSCGWGRYSEQLQAS